MVNPSFCCSIEYTRCKCMFSVFLFVANTVGSFVQFSKFIFERVNINRLEIYCNSNSHQLYKPKNVTSNCFTDSVFFRFHSCVFVVCVSSHVHRFFFCYEKIYIRIPKSDNQNKIKFSSLLVIQFLFSCLIEIEPLGKYVNINHCNDWLMMSNTYTHVHMFHSFC